MEKKRSKEACYAAAGWLCCLLLAGCQALPQLFQAAEDVATADVVSLDIGKSALQKETDLEVQISIKNKDNP